jgi:hypothetical protein
MNVLREKLIGQVASELTSLPEEEIPGSNGFCG